MVINIRKSSKSQWNNANLGNSIFCHWLYLRALHCEKLHSIRFRWKRFWQCAQSTDFLPLKISWCNQHTHLSLQCSYPILNIECNDAYRHASMHHKFFHWCYCFNFRIVRALGLRATTECALTLLPLRVFFVKTEIDIGLSDSYCYCFENPFFFCRNMLEHIRCGRRNFWRSVIVYSFENSTSIRFERVQWTNKRSQGNVTFFFLINQMGKVELSIMKNHAFA